MSTKSNLSRITINIPKDCYKMLKVMARVYGVSIQHLIHQAIENLLPCSNFSHYPNQETLKAIKNIEIDKNLVECKNIKDLFEKLNM